MKNIMFKVVVNFLIIMIVGIGVIQYSTINAQSTLLITDFILSSEQEFIDNLVATGGQMTNLNNSGLISISYSVMESIKSILKNAFLLGVLSALLLNGLYFFHKKREKMLEVI